MTRVYSALKEYLWELHNMVLCLYYNVRAVNDGGKKHNSYQLFRAVPEADG